MGGLHASLKKRASTTKTYFTKTSNYCPDSLSPFEPSQELCLMYKIKDKAKKNTDSEV